MNAPIYLKNGNILERSAPWMLITMKEPNMVNAAARSIFTQQEINKFKSKEYHWISFFVIIDMNGNILETQIYTGMGTDMADIEPVRY